MMYAHHIRFYVGGLTASFKSECLWAYISSVPPPREQPLPLCNVCGVTLYTCPIKCNISALRIRIKLTPKACLSCSYVHLNRKRWFIIFSFWNRLTSRSVLVNYGCNFNFMFLLQFKLDLCNLLSQINFSLVSQPLFFQTNNQVTFLLHDWGLMWHVYKSTWSRTILIRF